MLTLKVITEETDRVIRGLEKKHFKGAQESIAKVIELNDKRRGAQNQLDKNLAEVNQTSKTIGMLMKEGKKEEAEIAKQRVAEIKEVNKAIQAEMDQAAEDMQNCSIQSRMFLTTKCPKVWELTIIRLKRWAVWKRNCRKTHYPIGNWQRNMT